MTKNTQRIFAVLALAGVCLKLFSAEPAAAGENDEASQDFLLGEHARISLITQNPGKEVYLAFGHSAIRVCDPENNIDTLFNYGVFSASSLDDPLFIPRFIYGQLDYMVYPFRYDAERTYDLEFQNRVWYEQTLNLNRNEADTLYRFLQWNVQPENRVYRYDFIKDNCSTRVIDALQKCTENGVNFENNTFYQTGATYRTLIDEKLMHRPGWNLLINIVLGSASDRPINAREAMYIPSYMMDIFDSATIRHGNVNEPLVSKKTTALQPAAPARYDSDDSSLGFMLWPLFSALFIVTCIQFYFRTRRGTPGTAVGRILDTTGIFIFGLMGFIVFFLSFISTHTATKGNFNLLWLWPTHAVMAFTILSRKKSRWQSFYWLIAAILCMLSMPILHLLPQKIHADIMPLQLIFATRFLYLAAVKHEVRAAERRTR